MKKIVKLSVATAMLMGMGAVSAQAADGVSLLSNVKVKGEIRPRYEMVDTDNKVNNANAVTNRFVLGVGADIAGTDWLSAYGEMTDVHSANSNYFDGTGKNGTEKGSATGGYNTVVDPEQTRLTQAYIDVKGGGALLRAGRQMVNLDNQRFVGAVGWRQMPQTYDAFLLAYSGIKNLNLAAAYVTQVNTIKADTDGGGQDTLDTRSVILHASYKVADALTVTAYDYMLSAGTGGKKNPTSTISRANGVGSDTVGIALTGKPKLGDIVLNYRAEYAMMGDPSMENSDYDGKDDKADSQYYNLELGVNMSGFLLGVGYEVQTADDDNDGTKTDKAFKTALGTNHKFNGWADQFLSTPADGLEDLNAYIGYKSKDLGLFKVVYHDFSAEDGGDSYGSEIDAVYKRAIPGVKGLTGMLKYAAYDADDGFRKYDTNGNEIRGAAVDAQKFWVMLDYKFTSN